MTRIATTTPRIVLIVLGIVLSSQAFGFDVDGYRSGMSLAEVQRHVGQQLNRLSGGDASQPSYMSQSPESLAATPIFTFCDDKLSSYSLGMDGGFSTFNHILERETARLGRGAYTAMNDEGRSSQLWITWQDGNTTEKLSLIIVGTNPIPSASRSWNAETICQPPKS
jgi:hypothetical protein